MKIFTKTNTTMKKLLLAAALVATSISANAQNYTIYDGANPSESFINSIYDFDGITASLDTVTTSPALQTVISATGTTAGYYIGGIGAAKFTDVDVKATIADYTGTVSNTEVMYNVLTDTTVLKIKFQFKSGAKTFGYEADLGGAVAVPTDFSFAMSEVKEVIGDDPTGDVITDEELLAIDEFQWVVICTANDGVCGANLTINNVLFTSLTVGLSTDQVATITSFPNPATDVVTFSQELSNVSVFDMKGNVIATFSNTKSINVSNYQAGLYYISSTEYTTKVVVK